MKEYRLLLPPRENSLQSVNSTTKYHPQNQKQQQYSYDSDPTTGTPTVETDVATAAAKQQNHQNNQKYGHGLSPVFGSLDATIPPKGDVLELFWGEKRGVGGSRSLIVQKKEEGAEDGYLASRPHKKYRCINFRLQLKNRRLF